jgi:hypothetical protein
MIPLNVNEFDILMEVIENHTIEIVFELELVIYLEEFHINNLIHYNTSIKVE